MRELVWTVIGAANGWIAVNRSQKEITRLRRDGRTFSEAHLTENRLVAPLMVILVGALYWRLTRVYDHDATVLAFGFFSTSCTLLALIDVDTHVLPRRVVLRAVVVSIALLTLAAFFDDQGSVVRMLIGSLTMWVALRVLEVLSRGGLGGGDVTLGLLLGLNLGWLSWRGILDGLFIGFIVGGLFAVVLLATRRVSRQHQFAFGPFLVVGALLTLVL